LINKDSSMDQSKRVIFVTGGVLSSLGKGIVASSLGTLLEKEGLNVTIVKADPYLNIDSGTMSPYQHGEVFVTEDGAETDLDLGYYERFLNRPMTKQNHITSGKVFFETILRERKGDYLGGTVQVIPHITDEIKRQILNQPVDIDVIIVEIGGTVGDIESLPFLEAVRQLRFEIKHTLSVHVTLVPFIETSGEIKTKPTQHSVKELRSLGLNPDLIVCRSSVSLPKDHREKIALFANMHPDCVFENPDVKTIYQVPLILQQQGMLEKVMDKLSLTAKNKVVMDDWKRMVESIIHPLHEVNIAIVGKYSSLADAYKSINESLLHAGIALNAKVNIHYIPSEELEEDGHSIDERLQQFDGILVPGGFGERGIKGKIATATYCRINKKPYFGICLGMQLAVIEYVQNVIGYAEATSAEFNPQAEHKVFHLMTDWIDDQNHVQQRTEQSDKGGTMRLGSQLCELQEGTQVYNIYKRKEISERHRHRYELNSIYIDQLQKHGMTVAGYSAHQHLAEVIELSDHPWFIGTQFHPEFQSKPTQPHPLFVNFIKTALEIKSS
jgi:CTP synthase